MARTLELDTLDHPGNTGTANIVLSSDGTTTMPTVNINGGAIDGAIIGAQSPSTVVATTIIATTLDTGQGANELYDMDQNVKTNSAVTFATIDTGHGANELYDMDQNVKTDSAVSFATVNTGQGANELYDMNQNVETGSTVTFGALTVTGDIDCNGSNIHLGGRHRFVSDSNSGYMWLTNDAGSSVDSTYSRLKCHTLYSSHLLAVNSMYASDAVAGYITTSSAIFPSTDGDIQFGGSSKRWSNIYTAAITTGDIHLSNVGTGGNEINGTEGSWTIQEGDENLFVINRETGKKYKIKLEEV